MSYRRSVFAMVVSIVLAVFAGLAVWLIVGIFTGNELVIYGLSFATFAILFFSAIFSENVSFEIENGKLRYYKRGKLKGEYEIGDYYFRYRMKSDISFPPTHDIALYLLKDTGGEEMPENTEEEIFIDCSPLGKSRFLKMFAQIEEIGGPCVPKLETIKKQ